jgi:hypothetical protein
MSAGIKRAFVTIALLAMLGQNAAYAFVVCMPLQANEPVSSGDCHEQSADAHAPMAAGGEIDCEHGCDSHCSGASAHVGGLSVLSGILSAAVITPPADHVTLAPPGALFRPPISS